MQAVIEISGKQYLVEKGSKLKVASQNKKLGDKFVVSNVLMTSDQSKISFDKPVKINAKVLEDGLDKKIRVFKHRAKKRYRRTQGHRQSYTMLQIESIEAA